MVRAVARVGDKDVKPEQNQQEKGKKMKQYEHRLCQILTLNRSFAYRSLIFRLVLKPLTLTGVVSLRTYARSSVKRLFNFREIPAKNSF